MNEYWYLAWLALAKVSVLGTLSLTSRSGWPLAVAVQHCSASAAGPPPLRGGPVTQTAPGVAGRTAGTAHPRLHQKPQYHAVVGRRRNHGCCINGRSRASQQAETHPRGAAALASGWYNFCLLMNSWVDNQGFLMGWGIRWQQSVVVCNLSGPKYYQCCGAGQSRYFLAGAGAGSKNRLRLHHRWKIKF